MTGLPSTSLAVRNDQATWTVAQAGWRYNLTILREQAKSSAVKAKQYNSYLVKLDVDDAYVVAYAAALATKFGGAPPVTAPPVNAPPVTEPPVIQPPVIEPPVTEPPVNGPGDGGNGNRKHIYQGFRYNSTLR